MQEEIERRVAATTAIIPAQSERNAARTQATIKRVSTAELHRLPKKIAHRLLIINPHRLPDTAHDASPQLHFCFSVTVNMSWHSFRAIMTSLLEGSPFAIAITALIAFGLPVLLHFIFYRAVASPPRSNFLLLGPAGAGKTALLSLVRPS
jgi:hypothetical protein